MVPIRKSRTNNCRAFYLTKECMFGEECKWRHEHRNFGQIARHYYTTKVYTLESLYSYHKDQSDFLDRYESDASRLSVFKTIHAEDSDEDSTSSDDISDNDSKLAKVSHSDDDCLLNTTVGSLQEELNTDLTHA